MQYSSEWHTYNHSRPRLPDARPHTVHAPSSASGINFIAEEDESSDNDHTPRASAAGQASHLHLPSRRLSRDDTANDLHLFTVGPALPNDHDHKPVVPPHSTRFHRQLSRQSLSRTTTLPSTSENKPPSLGRRMSKHARDGVDRLADRFQRYNSLRVRRSSTPSTIERDLPSVTGAACIGSELLTRPPTSPAKRSATQADGPRKQRVMGDRKDTPAPSTWLPLRPASQKHSSTITAPGGESARKAAAMHNNHAIPAASSFITSQSDWESFPPYNDMDARRRRLGSLSSAADSGADLSTYSGSDLSLRDEDGDITMRSDDYPQSTSSQDQPSFDMTKKLPTEITLQILEYLDAPTLAIIESVNKRWQALATETSVWRTIFLRKYHREPMTDPAPIQVGGQGIGRPNRPNQEWRRMYRARMALEKNWRAGADDAGKAVYLSGHTDSVYCLQFDEEKIITGSRDRTIRVWDINTFQCLRVIGAPQYKPTLGPKVLRTVDYPSFHMATASVNGTAYGDGIYHTPAEWHDASILCLQYDSEILVTGSSDSDLLVWDIKTYQPIRRLKKHTGGVLDVALDAKHIVSCSKDSRIIVWDRETYEPKGELTGHRGPVNAVQLRGHLLVSASGDGIARLWDLKQMKLIKEFSAKERGLAAVEFSEDMKYVLAGGNDNITYKFETETGNEVQQFKGHSQLVRSLWLDCANDRVVSGSYDLDLRVYDFTSGAELWRGEEWTTSWMLAAKSDYRRIVATSQDGRILIVDFGILKGAPNFHSRDGQVIEDIDLLRGMDHTTAISFRNPFNGGRPIHGYS